MKKSKSHDALAATNQDLICHIDPTLTQEEIDNQPTPLVFPYCTKCNPNYFVVWVCK